MRETCGKRDQLGPCALRDHVTKLTYKTVVVIEAFQILPTPSTSYVMLR